ncbi:MAG: hypothetical protein HY367_03985 [Candidatus Aenigmarchaeota archaeon]|nr:hypothetical protein [Candidatus Aenigmarchaeota archaeon]
MKKDKTLTEDEFYRRMEPYGYGQLMENRMEGYRKKIREIIAVVRDEIKAGGGFMRQKDFLERVVEIADSMGIPPLVCGKLLKEMGY